jgi:hypothetical protein
VLGERVTVTSDVAVALDRVEDTYAGFRCAEGVPECGDVLGLALRSTHAGARFHVSGGVEPAASFARRDEAIINLLGRLVGGLLPRLQRRGITLIHAGAVVHRGRAIVIGGRSGQGKTTLVLGLIARGLGLLSDEFAVIGCQAGAIAPYRRGVHIRPGTPELIPQLGFLGALPRHELGGGIEWALTPAQLEGIFPACLAAAAPPSHVILLDGEPAPDREPQLRSVPGAVAVMELLHGTWAASVDFPGSLRAVGDSLGHARCARLQSGRLDATIDRIIDWVEQSDA